RVSLIVALLLAPSPDRRQGFKIHPRRRCVWYIVAELRTETAALRKRSGRFLLLSAAVRPGRRVRAAGWRRSQRRFAGRRRAVRRLLTARGRLGARRRLAAAAL